MADTVILSGIEASDALYNSLHARIDALKEKGITPGLAAILVGENPASQIYVPVSYTHLTLPTICSL